MEALGKDFPALFSERLGTADCSPYEIELEDTSPVRSPPYRCSPPKVDIFKKLVNELLDQGVIRVSRSPYASPAFLIPKPNGEVRLVVDYRKVNKKVVFDSYPMPTIDQALEQFGGAVRFTVLDLNSAYYQIPLSPESRRVAAFCTPFGLFEFNKLPMGICIGCQGLSRVIDELFSDFKGDYVVNFLDDLVVYSRSTESHEKHVREVLARLEKAGFTLNPKKVVINATEIKFLGHLISARGVKVLPDRVEAVIGYPRPSNLRQLRRFLGMSGFYARFIPSYSEVAEPLHELKRKGMKFKWGEAQQGAFEDIKKALCRAPVLQLPDFSKDFVLSTDASDYAISAVLQQCVQGDLAPIAYYSRLLTPAERRYSTYEKECLAVLFGCEKCRSYLEHKEFELWCDNLALCWLLRRTRDMGRLGRWILRLTPFKFRVKHTKGVENAVADALSRMFEGGYRETPEVLCATLWESLPLIYTSLEDKQKEDPECKDIRAKVLSGESGGEKFQVHGNRVCYYPRGAKRRRYVVPLPIRGMVMTYFHDNVMAGHLGAWKTIHKAAAHFWWPRMKRDIFDHVRKCALCQRAKASPNTRVGFHSSDPLSYPMERVFLDFVGPLTRTKRGNVAILVVVDGFSKFVSFNPVRRISSDVVVEYLQRWYFPAYGAPKSMVTDNASVFRCKRVKDLCFRWGIGHITTTPYYPQASLAERANRNLKALLKIFHHDAQTEWDEQLPWMGLAFNKALHESHLNTPDVLFLGREMRDPLQVRWDLTSFGEEGKHKATAAKWREAYVNLVKAKEKVARRYNANRKAHGYSVGDAVMYRLHPVSSKIRQHSAKLSLKWSPPLTVAKFVRPNVVLLANPETGVVVRRAHVSQLKAYVS
jgi:hypothetical protein